MKLDKDEMFKNLSGFLSSRGVEFKDGSYVSAVHKTCAFLTEAFNMGQEGFERARTEVEKNLDRVRQVIHEQTAPRNATPPQAPPVPPMSASAAATPASPKPKTTKTKAARSPKAKAAPVPKKNTGKTKKAARSK